MSGDEKHKVETLCEVTLQESKLAHSLGKFAVIMEKITDNMDKWAWGNAHSNNSLGNIPTVLVICSFC